MKFSVLKKKCCLQIAEFNRENTTKPSASRIFFSGVRALTNEAKPNIAMKAMKNF